MGCDFYNMDIVKQPVTELASNVNDRLKYFNEMW